MDNIIERNVFMKKLSLLFVVLLSLSCSGTKDKENKNPKPLGKAQLYVVYAPPGVGCVVVSASDSTRTVSTNIDVDTEASFSVVLDSLPTGVVALSAEAYNVPCSSVDGSCIPTWVSYPREQVVILEGGVMQNVSFTLIQNGIIDAGFTWTPDGVPGHLYIGMDDGKVKQVTPSGGLVGIDTIRQLYNPYGIVGDSSGHVYVTDFNNNSVSRVLVSSLAVNAFIPVVQYPSSLGWDGSGHIYVSSSSNGNTSLISISTASVDSTLTGVAGPMSFDGHGHMYIGTYQTNSVSRVLVSSGLVDGVTNLSGTLTGIAWDGDAYMYAATSDNKVTRISVSSGVASNQIIMTSPTSVVWDGAHHMYVVNRLGSSTESTVSVLSTITNQIDEVITVGKNIAWSTQLIAWDMSGHVYTCNSYDGTISSISTVTKSVDNIFDAGGTGNPCRSIAWVLDNN